MFEYKYEKIYLGSPSTRTFYCVKSHSFKNKIGHIDVPKDYVEQVAKNANRNSDYTFETSTLSKEEKNDLVVGSRIIVTKN